MLLPLALLALASAGPSDPHRGPFPAGDLACTDDGWCTVFPAPVHAVAIAARNDRLVAGTAGGVLVLWDQHWTDAVDTGLSALETLVWRGDGVVACDATHCVAVSVSDALGSPVPTERPAEETPQGSLEDGRWQLRDRKLEVDRGEGWRLDPRVRSQAINDALPGDPAWVTWGGYLARLGPTLDDWTRYPAGCGWFCDPRGARLAGGPDAPFALFASHGAHDVRRFDGQAFPSLLRDAGPGAYKGWTFVHDGDGCAPCLVGMGTLAWRTEAGWEVVRHEHRSDDVIGVRLVDGKPVLDVSRAVWDHDAFLRANLQDQPYEGEDYRDEVVRWDGAHWVTAGRWVKSKRAPAQPLRDARTPDDCTARLPNGEVATVRGTTLTIGGRTERLPDALRNCHIEGTGAGLLLHEPNAYGVLLQRWSDLERPAEPPAAFHVVDVASDDVLNLRAGPHHRAPKVGEIAPGACVTTSATAGTWRRVQLAEGGEGWASGRYLREGCGGE